MAIKFLNTVQVDTDVLYVDTDNNRVGIGTASPSVKLEVAGNIGLKSDSAYLRFRNAAAADLGYITNSTTWGDSGSDFSIGASSSNLRFYTNNSSTERMRITSAGNVGIGTTSPDNISSTGTVLSISTQGGLTTDSLAGSLTFLTNDASFTSTYADGVTTEISSICESATGAAYGLSFSTSTITSSNRAERMRIDSSGNVGIGTTSPAAKLDIISSGLSTMFRLSNTEANATTKYGAILGRHYTNAEENVTGMLITSSSSATGGSVSIGGGISSANAVNEIKFYTAANNTTLTGTERMRITSGGNVGIGTTGPQSLLEVSGSIASTIPALGEDSDLFQVGGTTYGTMFGSVSNGNGFIQQQRFDGSATAYNLLLQPNGGNVGIGTTSPSAKLEVNGGVKIGDATTGATFANSGTVFLITGVDTASNAFNSIHLKADSLDTGLVIQKDTNNVGIGTTSPSQKLEVSTDAQIVSKFVGNTNDGTGFIGAVVEIETNNDTRGRGVYLTHRDSSDTSDSEWYMGTPYNGGGLSIGNAAYGTSINSATGPAHKDQSKLFITEAGNIGIGATSPSVKLEIKGDATGDDTAQLIIASGGADNNSIIHFTDDAGGQVNAIGALEGQILTLASQNELVFKTGTSSILGNTNTRMTIDTNGKVGIGTTSPASKLQVNGGVQIANDTDAASADKVGTLKYYVSGNNSYVDMCMQTGPTAYAWVNITQNNW